MRKLRLYLDTSTISHLFADDTPDKMRDTNLLWDDIASEEYEILLSPVVMDEVGSCSEPKRGKMFDSLKQISF